MFLEMNIKNKENLYKMEFEFEFNGENGLPSLKFNESTGLLKIYGKSLVLSKDNFYEPLYKKMEEYLKIPRNINIEIDLEYFNTVSAKCLLDLFKMIEEKQIQSQRDFFITWYYDDIDIKESGNDFASILKYPDFEFIEKI